MHFEQGLRKLTVKIMQSRMLTIGALLDLVLG